MFHLYYLDLFHPNSMQILVNMMNILKMNIVNSLVDMVNIVHYQQKRYNQLYIDYLLSKHIHHYRYIDLIFQLEDWVEEMN
jgi:hypothetical protein